MRALSLLVLTSIAIWAGDLSGQFQGQWKSDGSGGGGSFRLTVNPKPDGTLKCDVTFAFQGSDVKTTMRTCTVKESKLDAEYDFELQGNVLRSKVNGQLNGKALDGHYQTTTASGDTDVDAGSWNATSVP